MFSCMQNSTVVKLVPPRLDKGALAEKIVCTRPMREGRFQIGVEQLGSKTIVHCYGHGGSGATTLFGSVEHAIALYKQNGDQKAPIRVIGTGMMGLTAAIELHRLGYPVKGIFTKERYDIPSWKHGGYFALVSIKNAPEEEANCNRMGMQTFLTYREIHQNRHPYLKDLVRLLPVYCSKETESGIESLAEQGLIPLPKEVALDFGNEVRHANFLEYQTYFMNPTELMKQLLQELERLGIPINMREIRSFDEVEESVIFNCSGLGARELCKDRNMIPVRGHLVMLNEKSGSAHMDYMIYSKVEQEGNEEWIYLFPKPLSVSENHPKGLRCQGTLGGTFIPDVDFLPKEEQEELDRKEFQKLLDRSSLFFTGRPFR